MQADQTKKDAPEKKNYDSAASKENSAPKLGALEEDDEFEEFVAEGAFSLVGNGSDQVDKL